MEIDRKKRMERVRTSGRRKKECKEKKEWKEV